MSISPGAFRSFFIHQCAGNDHPGYPHSFFSGDVFYVSGSRIAFFSLSDKEINILKTKQDSSWRRIVNLLEEPKALLASLLIANILLNIGIIILSNFLIDQVISFKQDYLVFRIHHESGYGEFCADPVWGSDAKSLGQPEYPQFAFYTSGVTEVIHLLFRRLGNPYLRVSLKNWKDFSEASVQLPTVWRNWIMPSTMIRTEEEKNILKGIIKFGNITVKQIMKTRLDVSGIEDASEFRTIETKNRGTSLFPLTGLQKKPG